MKTLTVTAARQNLGGWLKRATAGEEIGVVFGDRIVALRPVPIVAADYAETEYGLTQDETLAAGRRIVARVRREKTTPYTPSQLLHAHRTDQKVSRRRKKAA